MRRRQRKGNARRAKGGMKHKAVNPLRLRRAKHQRLKPMRQNNRKKLARLKKRNAALINSLSCARFSIFALLAVYSQLKARSKAASTVKSVDRFSSRFLRVSTKCF